MHHTHYTVHTHASGAMNNNIHMGIYNMCSMYSLPNVRTSRPPPPPRRWRFAFVRSFAPRRSLSLSVAIWRGHTISPGIIVYDFAGMCPFTACPNSCCVLPRAARMGFLSDSLLRPLPKCRVYARCVFELEKMELGNGICRWLRGNYNIHDNHT